MLEGFLFSPVQEKSTTVPSCDAVARIKMLQQNAAFNECILQIGPFKITVSDLLTTLPPGTLSAKETQRITNSIPTFTGGWLTDTVSS